MGGLQPGDVTTIEQMCRELGACPVCGNNFDGHAWTPFATIVLAGKNSRRITKFFEALDEQRWKDLREFHEWDAGGDNAEAIAIRCATGDLAMAFVHSSVNQQSFKRVERCKCAGGESAREVAALIDAASWQPLEPLPAAPDAMLPT